MGALNHEHYIETLAKGAKTASTVMAGLNTKDKNAALEAVAAELTASADTVIAENKKDLQAAGSEGMSKALLERLTLDRGRIEAMARSVRDIVALPDPVGSGNLITRRPNGLRIQRVRVPLGVVAMIYESRPNVTVDAAALCLKSGNAVILRGGHEAIRSNVALASAVRKALSRTGLPENAVQLVERTDREVVDRMLRLDRYIDVVIPRGGEGLIRSVTEKSVIPVIKHDKGVCHVFVDASADPVAAERIVVNAKCQRPSVCNAAESLLLHRDFPDRKRIIRALRDKGVEIFADQELKSEFPELSAAAEENWSTEYLDFRISARLVRDVREAVEHVNRYGSRHSDAIVSSDYANIEFFLNGVDSAAVYANASTRFTDGGEFGLGAEVGISTQKLHARGPMGLEGLTCEKWLVHGDGHIRE